MIPRQHVPEFLKLNPVRGIHFLKKCFGQIDPSQLVADL